MRRLRRDEVIEEGNTICVVQSIQTPSLILHCTYGGEGNTSFPPLVVHFQCPPPTLWNFILSRFARTPSSSDESGALRSPPPHEALRREFLDFKEGKIIWSLNLFYFYFTLFYLSINDLNDVAKLDIELDDNNYVDWNLDIDSLGRSKYLCKPLDGWQGIRTSLNS